MLCKTKIFSSSVTFISFRAKCEILITVLIFRHLKKYLLSKDSCYMKLPDSKYRRGIKRDLLKRNTLTFKTLEITLRTTSLTYKNRASYI
jgi:hypothetical protein